MSARVSAAVAADLDRGNRHQMALATRYDIYDFILLFILNTLGFPHKRTMENGAALGKDFLSRLFPQHLFRQHEASSKKSE